LLDWSIREYRHVMRQAEPGSLDDLNARLMLAELLHDQAQDEEAAVVLQGAVEQMETNPVVLHRMGQQLEREPASVKSRMHYFFAESFRAQANLEKQREHLRQGVADDPKDADVLIAMYRLQRADPAWRQQTRDLIRKAAEEFDGEIQLYTQFEAQADNEALRAAIQYRLATLHNQLAWLIGNTEGDYQRALESSQQSLKYRPDTAGYLDTLARCYFALKDHENAVKYQRRATELEPHSGQIRRQLTLFEEALRTGGED
jgi:tetratricopeptide (TPR) repeat protein